MLYQMKKISIRFSFFYFSFVVLLRFASDRQIVVAVEQTNRVADEEQVDTGPYVRIDKLKKNVGKGGKRHDGNYFII